MSLRPPASRSSWPATVGRGVRSHRWLPALALMLVTLVASLMFGRALWPGAATPRVVRGTVTAVGGDRTAIGFMPDGHRDPDPSPPLGERLTDWRYGFRNTFTGYEIRDAPWADADGAWHHGTAPHLPGGREERSTRGAWSGRDAARRRRPPRPSGGRLAALPVAGRGHPSARSALGTDRTSGRRLRACFLPSAGSVG
jgi:hypothetical protein